MLTGGELGTEVLPVSISELFTTRLTAPPRPKTFNFDKALLSRVLQQRREQAQGRAEPGQPEGAPKNREEEAFAAMRAHLSAGEVEDTKRVSENVISRDVVRGGEVEVVVVMVVAGGGVVIFIRGRDIYIYIYIYIYI